MKDVFWDRDSLLAVSPIALSTYACSLGWTKSEPYGEHSDVFVGENLPEIILPRTQRLGDYASVVSQLIDYYSNAAGIDAHSLYRDLLTADRDVIRVRAAVDQDASSVAVNDGIELLAGARELVLAAACSLQQPQPYYRTGANKKASQYLSQVDLGHTEQGSFVIALLSPTISEHLQSARPPDWPLHRDPFERQVTRRLADALQATHDATRRTEAGDSDAFHYTVDLGVSANLCEALVQLIGPHPRLDISVSWARTYPRSTPRTAIRFDPRSTPILAEAAREFRAYEERPGSRIQGTVRKLTRDQHQRGGTVGIRVSLDGTMRSITALLRRPDYRRAVHAHDTNSTLVLRGDLKRFGHRWHLLNAQIEDVIVRQAEEES